MTAPTDTNRERQLAVEEFMDKNNDFENAVEVTSVTTEHPKSKNRIKKRHESKLRKTLRIIKNIICNANSITKTIRGLNIVEFPSCGLYIK